MFVVAVDLNNQLPLVKIQSLKFVVVVLSYHLFQVICCLEIVALAPSNLSNHLPLTVIHGSKQTETKVVVVAVVHLNNQLPLAKICYLRAVVVAVADLDNPFLLKQFHNLMFVVVDVVALDHHFLLTMIQKLKFLMLVGVVAAVETVGILMSLLVRLQRYLEVVVFLLVNEKLSLKL